MLLPALSRAKGQAQSIRCKSNLHQMGLALQMYVDDHRNRYPCWWNLTGANAVPWSNLLAPYYKLNWQDKAYHCQAYQGQIVGLSGVLPIDTMFSAEWGSYAYNKGGTEVFGGGAHQSYLPSLVPGVPSSELFLGLSGTGAVLGDSNDSWPHPLAISAAQIQAPSEMFAISDSRVAAWGPISSLYYGEDWMDLGRAGVPEVQAPRHGKGVNVLHCDGGVNLVHYRDFIDPRITGINYNNDHQPHPETWSEINLP